MASKEGLEPPPEVNISDAAESSDSEDQFTDAQSAPMSSHNSSPIPKTRVERVDDKPAHGEVAGTEAHELRLEDAQPDEVAIIPEAGTLEHTGTAISGDVPATVLETSPGSLPGPYSAEFEEKRKADAAPDVVITPGGTQSSDGSESTVISRGTEEDTLPEDRDPPAAQRDDFDDFGDDDGRDASVNDTDDHEGDDFDDFEEGGEDDDFDDFEDGFQQAEPTPAAMPGPLPEMVLPFDIPDFDGLAPEDVIAATEPYLASLYPPEELDLVDLPPPTKDFSLFSTPRSASLWSQLVAPPPLAPPDWIRSRTRRLFLVSLGVPVDLDEILPASKQKKLVLPSLNIPSTSPRTSTETRSLSRIRQGDGNASSTSVDTQGKPSKSKTRKGPPPQPDLDLVSARHLCMTTGEALNGMTEDELKTHVKKLESMQGKAKEVLEYWQKRTDEKIGDREAFEGVIENLVKHARKVRK